MSGYVQCPDCSREIVSRLFRAHLRRHAGTDWFSERRPALVPRPGLGSRDRAQAEGRGSARHRYQRTTDRRH